MDDQVEIWREIPGYEGFYSVSNTGKIKSLRTRTNSKAGACLKIETIWSGYNRVHLVKGGRSKKFSVHRLVASVFLSEYTELLEVNHIDGDKSNNHVTNLEMCTSSQNKKHAFKIGARTQTGSRNSMHKLTEDSVREIKLIYAGGDVTQKDIAKQFGVTRASIGCVIQGRSWKHVKEDALCQTN